MLTDAEAFSSFAVDDLARARDFYGRTLGLRISDVEGVAGIMQLQLAGGRDVLVYEKSDHTPATYTILNFRVPDVDAAVDELIGRGVSLERYEGFEQDERGVARGNGPTIAWFTDPSGNVLAVLER
jgi:catechol 2,3-dioxygenase-like lactoylglutathione lyase family enzyme